MKRTLIHRKEVPLDGLVQTDLGSVLGEVVEDYISEYCEEHGIKDSEMEYGWSCVVVVEIYRKEVNSYGGSSEYPR